MKTLSTYLLLVIFSATIFNDDCSAGNVFTAKVQSVIDGDSLTVNDSGRLRELRFWGIDSPEWDQPYATEAQGFVEKIIGNKTIQVKALYNDEYGRIVAMISVNNMNMNQKIIEEGYAWVHPFYCNKPICEKWKILELKARQKRLGLWQEGNSCPPWRWRRQQ